MTLDEYMKTANEKYRKKQRENIEIDETAFNRDFLLSIGQCEYTEKEFYDLLNLFVSPKSENNAINGVIKRSTIDDELHHRFLLKIEYRGNKPLITEDCQVWLNLRTKELSAQKHFTFGECGEWVIVRDYQLLNDVKWNDLIERCG